MKLKKHVIAGVVLLSTLLSAEIVKAEGIVVGSSTSSAQVTDSGSYQEVRQSQSASGSYHSGPNKFVACAPRPFSYYSVYSVCHNPPTGGGGMLVTPDMRPKQNYACGLIHNSEAQAEQACWAATKGDGHCSKAISSDIDGTDYGVGASKLTCSTVMTFDAIATFDAAWSYDESSGAWMMQTDTDSN